MGKINIGGTEERDKYMPSLCVYMVEKHFLNG